MPKFEYKTLRVQPQQAESKLNELGAEGFQVVSTDVVSNKLVIVLQKEKVGRPKKKG